MKFISAVLCPMLEELVNGRIECTNGNEYQSRCYYICDNDYKIAGGNSGIRVCLWQDFWSVEAPACVGKLVTLSFDHVRNGRHAITAKTCLHVLHFRCDISNLEGRKTGWKMSSTFINKLVSIWEEPWSSITIYMWIFVSLQSPILNKTPQHYWCCF